MTKFNSIEIKPTTEVDIIEFFGAPLNITIKGYSVYWRGELSAIVGVTIHRGHKEFFCDVREGINPPKQTVWRAAKMVMEKFKQEKIKVFSIADDDIPGSDRFLQALGFEYAGEFNNMKHYRLG